MDTPNTFESYDTAVDTLDQAQIDQVLREIEWEAHINTMGADFGFSDTNHTRYTHLSGYTAFDGQVSPSSGLGSPGTMTTGSTNPSPLAPLLDYDLGIDTTASTIDDSQLIFPELMTYPVDIQDDWPSECLGDAPDFDLAAFSGSAPCLETTASFPYLSEDSPQQTSTWDAFTIADYTYHTTPDSRVLGFSKPAVPSCVSASPSSTSQQKSHLTCPYCSAAFTDKAKLKIHTNKHTKPFKCSAAGCDYSTAEKKSLQRHLLAKSKWDEEHRLAAHEYGLSDVKYRCSKEGCTYSTIREDNLKRHMTTCL